MKNTIYDIIEEYIENDKTGSIATVISREGSAPRDAGAKMFVGEDGQTYETIGGGNLEFKVQKQAMTTMNTDEPQFVRVNMEPKEVTSDGMICGGEVEVFLEPIQKKHLELYRKLEQMEKNGKKGILITNLNGKLEKTLVDEDMTITGDDIKIWDTNSFFQNNINKIHPQTVEDNLIETIHPSPLLYIFGAGHISQFIAPLANTIGFQVVIIDDRSEFANKERFPDAHELIVKDFQEVFNQLKFSGEEFVVIVTRGHQYDRDVLEESLKRKTKYLGMIGSKMKVKMILEQMRKLGYDEEKVDNVYSPIGLSINADTPQEIAVSIAAELIKVRRNN